LERLREADLILWVFDAAAPLPVLPEIVTDQTSRSRTLAVANKIDLLPTGATRFNAPEGLRVLPISALTGSGVEALVTEISRFADAFQPTDQEEIVAINARHADALTRARTGLREALEKLAGNGPMELLASDLRGTLAAFGDIGGKVDNERMLDHLFASFCIGK
jgi:tRNA modification GTPase